MLQKGEDGQLLPRSREGRRMGGSQGWAAASTSTEQRSWQTLWAPAQGYRDTPLVFCCPSCRHALFSAQVGELGTASTTAKQLSLAPMLCHGSPLSPQKSSSITFLSIPQLQAHQTEKIRSPEWWEQNTCCPTPHATVPLFSLSATQAFFSAHLACSLYQSGQTPTAVQ